MVIGLLGILKAGGAYLPLDPGYPAERLAFMLQDAGAAVLLTQSGLIERLSAVAAAAATTRIVRIDADWPDVARQPTAAPKLELHPQHPAYVIYTSGSTGTPKGVVVSMAARQLDASNAARTSTWAVDSGAALFTLVFVRRSIDRHLLPLVGRRQPCCIRESVRIARDFGDASWHATA